MTAKRIIPCLDIRDGRVVKGVNFEGIQDVDDPVTLARYYSDQGADEVAMYDITASMEGRLIFADVLKAVAGEVHVPLTVGGGIGSLEDFDRVLEYGADKVSVNSGAIRDRSLIGTASKKYGTGRVVLSMDVKRVGSQFRLFTGGGRVDTGIDALEWAANGAGQGAGELVVNSIDTDGIRGGFDLELLAAVAERVRVPIIASGGAGSTEHFGELFTALPAISAGLAASVFHYKTVGIPELKRYLRGLQIPVCFGGTADGE